MNRREWLAGALAGPFGLAATFASAQTPSGTAAESKPPSGTVGEVKPLGQERFQIGRIVVDRRAGVLTVPGRVHLTQRPLEYLATTPRGLKEYETLLEVDATGTEFNLACILLGLERSPAQGRFQQFSLEPVTGPRVAISVSWLEDGKRRQLSAAEALLGKDVDIKPESVEWVYTGSVITHENLFGANVTGSLIGFVHDPYTIIEAVKGIGIGSYGIVHGNPQLPPVGTPIEMTVEVVRTPR